MATQSNSERLNAAFDDLAKKLDTQFLAIDGQDTIAQGTHKIVSNLEALAGLLQFDAHGNIKSDGKRWFDRFVKVLDEKGRDSSKGVTVFTEDVIIEAAKKATGIDNG